MTMLRHAVGWQLVGVLLLALLLSACATPAPPEPVIRTVEVLVPTPVGCVPKSLPQAPAYADTREALRAAPSAEDRYQLLAAGWFIRDARLQLLEGVVANCGKVAPP